MSMRWKGRVFLLLLILLLLFGVIQLIRWAKAKENDPDATFILPRVSMANMNIQRLDPDATTMLLVMTIDQPAPIGLTVDSLDYTLSIAGNEVIHSTYPHAVSIGAYDSASISLPVTIRTKRLIDVLKQLEAEGRDSVIYAMDTRFHLPAAFWTKKPMEVRIERNLPLVRIPRVHLQDPSVVKFGFGESRINVDLALFNPNVFDLAFRDLAITADLEGHEVVLTSADTLIRAAAMDTAIIHLPMRIALGHMIEGVFDLLLKPARTVYSYHMEFTVISDQPSLDECHFIVVGKGHLDELKNWGRDAEPKPQAD
ncbi:MAG: LEA type 2 family protein [Flavobacteriales bacterium]